MEVSIEAWEAGETETLSGWLGINAGETGVGLPGDFPAAWTEFAGVCQVNKINSMDKTKLAMKVERIIGGRKVPMQAL
jgi:hypothetical protein